MVGGECAQMDVTSMSKLVSHLRDKSVRAALLHHTMMDQAVIRLFVRCHQAWKICLVQRLSKMAMGVMGQHHSLLNNGRSDLSGQNRDLRRQNDVRRHKINLMV